MENVLARAAPRDYEQAVILNLIFGILAGLSIALLIWQWLAARSFPLHRRVNENSFAPAVTLLKPVKGCDDATENCLQSWFTQNYSGAIQILFGVASADDPVCKIINKLISEFPSADARLVVCENLSGANAKVSKLAQLAKLATHEILVISDADVRVPADFLANAIAPLSESGVGLVNCFYRLQNPATLAMQWEAIAINADFWSQVLQSKTLKPLDFALGAVMVTRRKNLDEIGGFESLANCLADDYQLGNRIARKGHRIELCPVVVECWHAPQNFAAVWSHQLRWARTIRVCQPLPYFFSILNNSTIWPFFWVAFAPTRLSLTFFVAAICCRVLTALDLQTRLTRSPDHLVFFWLAPIKDLLQFDIWVSAFLGNKIEWRGQKFILQRDGTLKRQR